MRFIYLFVITVSLYGCASARDATITLSHSASTEAIINGNIKVAEVTRTLGEGISPSQFNTQGYTFGKQISLTEPLADNFKVALVMELRRAGANSRGSSQCGLSANILELGVTYKKDKKIDFIGAVSYELVSPNGQGRFQMDSTKTVETESRWVREAYSELLTDLIDSMILNEKFLSFVSAHCPK